MHRQERDSVPGGGPCLEMALRMEPTAPEPPPLTMWRAVLNGTGRLGGRVPGGHNPVLPLFSNLQNGVIPALW